MPNIENFIHTTLSAEVSVLYSQMERT